MIEPLRNWLARPYRIVAGCALLSGIAVGTIDDLRHLAFAGLASLLPTASEQTACVETYLDARGQKAPGSYLIILTDLVNDTDLTQTRLVDRTLRRLYGEDLGAAIQLEAIPCAIYVTSGNATERAEAARSLARSIADRAGADVVIWGEVIARDAEIALSMTHATDTAAGDYRVAESSLTTDFGEAIGALIAAKLLTQVTVTPEDSGNYLVTRMQRVLALTGPLVADPPDQMTAADHSALYDAHGQALYHIGLQSGDAAAMQQAVDAFRLALEDFPRQDSPLDWARVQGNLGIALRTLGAGQAGSANLEAAVAAFTAALEEQSPELVPLDWGITQNNLGSALASLGQRESGTERLEAAVVAFTQALTVRTRDSVPFSWAMTQNNLGVTLQILGDRDRNPARLEAAVAAFREALKEYTRDRVPLTWAATQNNLGNALLSLGMTEPGTARLYEAVTAFGEALKESRRDLVPLDWAMAQNNLGNALAAIGQREPGTKGFEDAAIAFDLALTERTRDKVPFDWAVTRMGQGLLDLDWFDKTAEGARLASARAHVLAAREVFVAAGAGHYVSRTDAILAQITDRETP
ncbi:MAG: tetratricopeptide repeat protein [Tabrizicola sp.]|nr:tetratricopeptide repeat protein [Tabrizicola sp.]